uniref:lipopolysaccharide heptosyltransferase II n=1 Tax=Desulfobacca acetoxidans TaxID=60893 RepID=A0A7C3Z2N0_9BACT
MSPAEPRILLIKLSSLGDVIHALPTLEALRSLYPRGQIIWLVEEANAPVLAGHPALDEIWPVPRPRLGSSRFPQYLRQMLQTAGRLREQPFDLVIDLQGLLKSAVWTALAGSNRKLGYNGTREFSYLPLTERLAPFDPEAHAVWRYLNVARHLGAPDRPPRFRLGLTLPPDLSRLVPESGQPLAVLHPGARWATKLWPAASWARLAGWLAWDKGFQVVVTGSEADRDMIEGIIIQAGRPLIKLAGRTSLAELAALLRKARFAVTTDTGPMHLAAALGSPVAALFGPTAPWRTGPFGDGHEVVRLGLACSPCFRRQCPEPRCLTELPVASVQDAVEKILLHRKNP